MLRPIATALLCLVPAAFANATPPADIDRYARRSMETFGAPGMAIAIVEDGATTLARGYGVRKLGEPDRVDERTLFPIGSNTKAITAAALAVLVDEGRLAWDDRVLDRLPGFRLYDAFASHEMTIRDLLTHRSGLGLGAGDLLFFPPTDLSRKEIVARLRHIRPATSFRSAYAYNNVLYIAAGELTSSVAGASWEEFIERRIFEPLGMTDSSTILGRTSSANRAWPHARLSGPLRGVGTLQPLSREMDGENFAPAGSIRSSAVDIAQWLKVQLAHGALDNGARLFSEEAGREMWRPHTPIPVSPAPAPIAAVTPTFDNYGLGWFVRDYRGHKLITHGGAVDGSLSVIAMLPEKRVGVAIMINSEDGAARWAVLYRLLDHYLGLSSPDWIDAYAQARRKQVQDALATLDDKPQTGAGPGPSLPMGQYAGVYRDPWYGEVVISAATDGLRIAFAHTPALRGALEHVRYDTFRTRFDDRNIEDAYVSFALKPDGTIEQMKMQVISPLADFSFDYGDLLFTPAGGELDGKFDGKTE